MSNKLKPGSIVDVTGFFIVIGDNKLPMILEINGIDTIPVFTTEDKAETAADHAREQDAGYICIVQINDQDKFLDLVLKADCRVIANLEYLDDGQVKYLEVEIHKPGSLN
jgi:hypothetical protein